MRGLLFAVLSWAAVSAAFAEDQSKPGAIMLSGGMSVGSLVSGEQYDNLHDGLNPTPSNLSYVAFQANLRVFPSTFFGFEVSSDLFSVTSASATGQTDLVSYYISEVSGGGLFRVPLPLSDSSSADVFLGGGVTYNKFTYASDYEALVPGSLYEVQPGLGYYAKAGASFYLGRPFFAVGELELMRLNDHIDETNFDFGGTYVKINLRAGMDF